jgi:hypothetical protein
MLSVIYKGMAGAVERGELLPGALQRAGPPLAILASLKAFPRFYQIDRQRAPVTLKRRRRLGDFRLEMLGCGHL